MAATVELWTPPAGMVSRDVRAWRAFYSRAMDLYRVTPADYLAMYTAQKGRCWICRNATGIHPLDPKARGSRRLGIDHNHVTGQVRGLLCTGGDKTCNRVIGWLGPAALRRAADYLDGTLTPGLVFAQYGDAERTKQELWSGDGKIPVVPPSKALLLPSEKRPS